MTEIFPQNLAFYRAKKGLTQRQLADLAGLSWSQISRYESGAVKPRLSALMRLADALGISTDKLANEAREMVTVPFCEHDGTPIVEGGVSVDKESFDRFVELADSLDISPGELLELTVLSMTAAMNGEAMPSLEDLARRLKAGELDD